MTAHAVGDGDAWLRSRPSRILLWATLILCLVLGPGVVATSQSAPVPGRSAPPLSDDEAVAQVVTAARQIVSVAQLPQASGGYSFQSCATTDEPPYQATVYASFAVPRADPARSVRAAAHAMAAGGWTRSPVAGSASARNSPETALPR